MRLSPVALALLWPWLAFAGAVFVIVIHNIQELFSDGAPIWEHLGLTWCYLLGLAGFVAFIVAQAFLAYRGFVDGAPWALWFLATIWFADAVLSHWRPWLSGKRPNPGIETSFLYAGGAVAIALALA
jgi:hypothetical protein